MFREMSDYGYTEEEIYTEEYNGFRDYVDEPSYPMAHYCFEKKGKKVNEKKLE